ncbi:MAG: LamG-like jellyroll fold domain-containing protein [Panacagrimonas sp.]
MRAALLSAAALGLALLGGVGRAQTLDPGEIAVFDGQSRLDYPGNPALNLRSPATVEFWVSAGWTQAPDYDPCVLASLGEAALNFAVHIAADRQAIGLFAKGAFAALPFDFRDGLMHHVAVISIADGLSEVQIDGASIGHLPLGFGDGPSLSFHLGSLDGEQAPFVGALARVRLWHAALDANTRPEDLAAQSMISPAELSLAVYPPAAGTRRKLQAAPSPVANPDLEQNADQAP